MPGLVPGMHVFAKRQRKVVDARHKPGQDGNHFPNRSGLKGLGSQNGVAPVIISAINRPVAGPSVNPQCPCPNASQSPR